MLETLLIDAPYLAAKSSSGSNLPCTLYLSANQISDFFFLLLCWSTNGVGFGCPVFVCTLINSRMLLDVCLSLMAHLVWSFPRDSRLTTVHVKNKLCDFKSLFSWLKSQYLPPSHLLLSLHICSPNRPVLLRFTFKLLTIIQDITEHTTNMVHAGNQGKLPFYIIGHFYE